MVKVNGKIVTKLGTKVDPNKDTIKFKNKLIKISDKKVYLLLHKPAGYICTAKDTHERKTIFELLPKTERLFSIGRLDKDSEGLIIVTNDGDLSYLLTHPKYGIEKEYYVECRGQVSKGEKEKLEKGIMVERKKTSPCKIKIIEATEKKTRLRITIHEGRKRQIRNMFEIIGHKVHYLQRTRIGDIKFKGLAKGKFRSLKKDEIAKFLKQKKL